MALYQCVKCGSHEYTQDEMRATGGFLAKLFDVQNKRFVTVSCAKCGYTELYKKSSNTLGNVLDFFTN
jgi:predicted nucleic-acid-binding Zn-ribbon protein